MKLVAKARRQRADAPPAGGARASRGAHDLGRLLSVGGFTRCRASPVSPRHPDGGDPRRRADVGRLLGCLPPAQQFPRHLCRRRVQRRVPAALHRARRRRRRADAAARASPTTSLPGRWRCSSASWSSRSPSCAGSWRCWRRASPTIRRRWRSPFMLSRITFPYLICIAIVTQLSAHAERDAALQGGGGRAHHAERRHDGDAARCAPVLPHRRLCRGLWRADRRASATRLRHVGRRRRAGLQLRLHWPRWTRRMGEFVARAGRGHRRRGLACRSGCSSTR